MAVYAECEVSVRLLCRERFESRCKSRGAVLACKGGHKQWVILCNSLPMHKGIAACQGAIDDWHHSSSGQVRTQSLFY